MRQYIASLVFTSLLLTGCSDSKPANERKTESSADLDQAAIDAGILPDPNNIKLEGRFETRNDIGTDKFCAIKTGDNSFNIGILAVFGEDSHCEGRGSARLDGEKVLIMLNEGREKIDERCEVIAKFDGISMQFPGELPAECAKFCNNRASLSGTQYFLTEEGNESAQKSNGRAFKPLCKG